MQNDAEAAKVAVPTLRQAVGNFNRLLQIVRPYWGGLASTNLLGLFVALLSLANPYLSKQFFDRVYPSRDVSLMEVLVFSVAAFGIATAVMSTIRAYFSQVVASKLGSEVGLMYFNHLQHLPISFFDQHRVGEVLSRVADVRSATGTISRVFQTLVVNGAYLVIVPPFLLLLNWRLSLLALIMTPVTVAISTISSRILRRFLKLSAEAGAELGAIQVEVLSQIRAVKSLSAEARVFADARGQSEELLRAQISGAAISAGVTLANSLVRVLGSAVFSWYAWTLILSGEMTLGAFVAFSGYLGYLTGPVGALTGLFADFQQSAVTLGRAFEYLDLAAEQDPAIAFCAAGPVQRSLKGTVRLDSVAFQYENGRPVLQDVCLCFERGSTTAIVGSSGAGKSSILRLLSRMAEPSRGEILIDGAPSMAIPLNEFRRQISVVWQEHSLFRGTIRQNLLFGNEGIALEKIDEVMSVCRLGELVESLPAGYDTQVAEWGATLSGGQRQRLAIARALLRDAPILLLDEATSQVDVLTEEALLRDLLAYARTRTVIFVTHRVTTACLADNICVLDAGRVVGFGPHATLLFDCPEYVEMLRVGGRSDSRVVEKPSDVPQ
jgi:ABC-type bacteriocin/lantibiotic exporter with double-glycine peptidase domain